MFAKYSTVWGNYGINSWKMIALYFIKIDWLNICWKLVKYWENRHKYSNNSPNGCMLKDWVHSIVIRNRVCTILELENIIEFQKCLMAIFTVKFSYQNRKPYIITIIILF